MLLNQDFDWKSWLKINLNKWLIKINRQLKSLFIFFYFKIRTKTQTRPILIAYN